MCTKYMCTCRSLKHVCESLSMFSLHLRRMNHDEQLQCSVLCRYTAIWRLVKIVHISCILLTAPTNDGPIKHTRIKSYDRKRQKPQKKQKNKNKTQLKRRQARSRHLVELSARPLDKQVHVIKQLVVRREPDLRNSVVIPEGSTFNPELSLFYR